MPHPLAVIVPAHNEAPNIGATLRSLIKNDSADIIVVADNCTDKTAEIAEEMGVRVLRKEKPEETGKPSALIYALEILLKDNYSFFAIVDADTVVEPNFTTVILEELNKGADAIQVRYSHQRGYISPWQRMLDIGFSAMNTVRPTGRQFWGLSSGILGNGFALARNTILEVPFNTRSLVEDIDYHLRLVRAGKKVHFTTKTTVWASLPGCAEGVRTQRARWEGGRLAALWKNGPALAKLIVQGEYRLLEPLLDLLLPPLATQTILACTLLFFPFPFLRIYAWIVLSIIALYVVTAIWIRREGWRDWASLAIAPFFMLWKLSMIPFIIKTAKNKRWLKTTREKER